MGNSFSNTVYRVVGEPLVLKLFSSRYKWWLDQHVTQLLAQHGFPVAQISSAGETEAGGWTVMTLLPGANLENHLQAAPPPVLEEAGEMLARLHQITFASYGLLAQGGLSHTYTDFRGHFAARMGKFMAHAAISAHLSVQEAAGCWAFFDRHKGALTGGHPCLVHRDFRPGNLLVDPHTWRITGLIDFESVQVGDPGLDFAKVEGELYRLRPGARAPFEAGYRKVRPLPDPGEVRLQDFLNTLTAIPWAVEHNSPDFLQRNLTRLRNFHSEPRGAPRSGPSPSETYNKGPATRPRTVRTPVLPANRRASS